jgi:DNA (cytosine-5)-methyltransferase 1
MRPPRLAAVSLFTNCGAGDLGYRRAGFRFQVMAELESRRLEVARLNHPEAEGVEGDLRDTWQEVVAAHRRRVPGRAPALLAACPPCQGISSARSGRGRGSDADAGSRDSRNLLVDVIASVAGELAPRLVVVENVSAFLTRRVRHPDTHAPISAAALLVSRLAGDYIPFVVRLDLADFGIPQTRKRSFLTLVRRGEPGLVRLQAAGKVPFPAPSHGPDGTAPHVSVTDALNELGAETLNSAAPEVAGSGMHAVPVYDRRRYQMVSNIPPGSGTSAWHNDVCPDCGKIAAADTDAWCPACGGPLARPVVPVAGGGWRLVSGFANSSYRRMRPDAPAATVTTASGRVGSDNTLHPTEHRVLSPWECPRLQTIPPEFRWGDHLKRYGHTSLRAMIGEAVPPQFTERHGRVLVSLLDGRVSRRAMSSTDQRVRAASKALGSAAHDTEAVDTPSASAGCGAFDAGW